MSLPPLSESAVAQLARRAERPSKGLHSLTGGNPLFVTEVLAAAADTVPSTVRDAVLARTARLSPAAREIAELVCVVPGKTELWLLEQAGRSDETGIEGCLSTGMVRHEDGSLAYRHELVRRAVGDSLSQPRLRSLHSKVLAVLEARANIPAARLAHHASCAHDAEGVRRFAPLAAAQAASVGAHREAASHFESMVSYADEIAPADRAHLLEQLSYECFLIGHYARASEARRAALEIWRGIGACTQEGNALRWLSRLAWFEGRRRGRRTLLCRCDSGARIPAVRARILAKAYCDRADLDMESHENALGDRFAHRAIALAEPGRTI